jgi:hypothetical protein
VCLHDRRLDASGGRGDDDSTALLSLENVNHARNSAQFAVQRMCEAQELDNQDGNDGHVNKSFDSVYDPVPFA